MSDNIRSIQAVATADTSQLEAGMSRAESAISGVGSESQRTTSRMQTLQKGLARVTVAATAVAAAAAAAGAAYAVHLVRQGLQAADEQAKLARQLGMTNEQLATLERAADLSGVAAGALTQSIQGLNRRLGESIDGSGATADALDSIGLSARELVNLAPEQQIQTIGAAMQQLGTHAERSAVAQQIFGRAGQQMLLLLDGSTETFERAAREVESFGLAINEIDAARIESINDNMSTLQQVTEGAARRMAVQLSPVLAGITDMIVEMAHESDFFDSVMTTAIDMVIAGIGKMGDVIQDVVLVIQSIALVWRQVEASILRSLTNISEGMFRVFGDMAESLRNIQDIPVLGNIFGGGAVGRAFVNMFDHADYTEFQANLEEQIARAEAQIDGLEQSIAGAADRTPFSEMVEAWVRDAEAARAEWEAGVREPLSLPTVFDPEATEESASEEREALMNALQSRLDAVRMFLMSEIELVEHHHEERLQTIRDALDQELITEQQYADMRTELEQAKQDELTRIAKDAAQQRLQFATQVGGQILGNLASVYSNMAQVSAKSEEEMFEARKKGARASAVVSTAQGIAQAWATHGANPVLASAISATVAAAGAAQIAAINRQSFGGGGSAPTAPSANTEQPQQRALVVQGDFDSGRLFSGEAVRGLMDAISEAQRDGYQVVMS